MSWFPSSNFASLAKNALKEAQKTIDKVLDIKDEGNGNVGNGSIDSTVSSVADAATDFFNSWGVGIGTSTKNLTPNTKLDTSVPVIISNPSSVLDKSPSTSALPSFQAEIAFPNGKLKKSHTSNDVQSEFPHTEADKNVATINQDSVREEPCPDSKFQSLWLDGSDSYESSIESSSTSTLEVSADSSKEVEVVLVHPKPRHATIDTQDSTLPSSVQEPLLINTPTPNATPEPITQVESSVRAPVTPLEEAEVGPVSQEEVESSTDSSIAESANKVEDNFALKNEVVKQDIASDLEIHHEVPSSKISTSSCAESSISVISDEKEQSSSQISPVSQHSSNNHEESPSFEVLPVSQQGGTSCNKSDSSSSFDIVLHNSQSQTSSVCVVPSLQSTPERGTPMSHSRSNSNTTSSSFDRIEDLNNRSKVPNHPFNSSASSSDIEVIPFESLEGLNIIHRKRRSLVEAETQTLEILETEPREKIFENRSTKISSLIEEKDSEILQLREEGEKLSKKQFELSNAIKKLRQKEKEMDSTVKGLKAELASKNIEIEKLTKTLIVKEAQDESQSQTISKLNSENRKLLNLVSQLRSELEDAKENAASMKASLEDASIEMLELQNSMISVQRDNTQLDQLIRSNAELTNLGESLQKEVTHLRESLLSTQQKASLRESELKTQLLQTTQHAHDLEEKIAESYSDVADATMPLSLEIEKLQHELNTKAKLWERKESSLQTSLIELKSKLKSQQESENLFKSSQALLQQSITTLEQENESMREQLSVLSSQLIRETEQKDNQSKILSEKATRLESKLEQVVEMMSKVQSENEILNNELKNEKNALQAEIKKSQMLTEQLRACYGNGQLPSNRISTSSLSETAKFEESRNTSPRSSAMSDSSYLEDVLIDSNGQNPSLTPKSFFDSFSSVNFMENMHGQLRQKELEIFQLHDEVGKNEKLRKTLNEEIAHLTVNNQELLQKLEKLAAVQERLTEVETNYNAVLQMYGEKVEEADELRMDLQDVKEMYKNQIEQLLKKS